MQSWSSKDFTADRAWGALDIANFSGTTVRLHWTDQPYIWHINDGQEVFAVMDGQVAMHVKVDGEEQIIMRVDEGESAAVTGDTVKIAARQDKLHWFDAGSGKRAA